MNLTPIEIKNLISGKYGNPFSLLGLHQVKDGIIARALIPGAKIAEAFTHSGKSLGELNLIDEYGLFEGLVDLKSIEPLSYRASNGKHEWFIDDPYSFGPIIGPIDDYLINEGNHLKLFDVLGAHFKRHQNVDGMHFAVWAPNASIVSIVGDFNDWDDRRHVMRKRQDTGIWEIFLPNIAENRAYKYQIFDTHGNKLPLKADPFAFKSELRPNNASVTTRPLNHKWQDEVHRKFWQNNDAKQLPISIYEVHAGSWEKGWQGEFLDWDTLADKLIPYVCEMGFTHIEFMPLNEHPLDESWGYQTTGLYSPSARFGEPEGLARFIDGAHKAGLGIIMDWVPAHFPTDEHGLARFDGTCLYEHEDPRLGFHPDWTTYIYNFERTEVLSFLVNNAIYWAEKFHIDGLRVDAVASMLYRDYSRKAGEWLPNKDGGRENWEAVNFLRKFNEKLNENNQGVLTIAEESTTWQGVTQNIQNNGLGFNFKWNMGFMNDTLKYMAREPIHRSYHHNEITFGLTYAFTENFVLPLSHDEVVHGKGSLINKMSGDDWHKFSNLRAYYGFMWGYPGKKLLFMGQEFAQRREWSEARSLDWELLNSDTHKGIQNLIKDLNNIYKTKPALHKLDCDYNGFKWAIVDDKQNSVFAWVRYADGANPIAIIANFSGQPLFDYKIPLPNDGYWCEIINTDSIHYGGSGMGNLGGKNCENGQISLNLPSLSTIMLEYKN